tara:strand:+ start:7102 stop:8211 length:1110 start_codon:yes stop_codon:yes gene_type:complete
MKKLRSQKNIIFYNPSFETGGVEKNIKSYIDHAQNLKNYKKILLTLDNTNINKNLYFQYPAKKFKFKSRLIKYFICFYYLFKISLKKDSIILSFQNNIFAILIAVITNTKIIVRLNTAPEKYINSYLQKKIFSFFYKLANLIIVNDEDFKKSVKKYFNINSKIIHNFVNYDEVKKQSRENVKKNFFKKKTSIKIITVGRLTEQKNHISLLQAINILKKKDNIELLILGSGDQEDNLKNYIKTRHLKKYVKLIRYKTNPFKYIRHSDVLILSSKYEGSPNILLEAACLKKLIISSNCKTGPKQILSNGKGGYLYQVNNYTQLSKIINQLKLNSKLVKKKISTSYIMAKKYNKKNQGIEFKKIIKKLIELK